METDDGKAALFQPPLKMRGHVIRPDGSSVWMDADIAAVDIGATKQFPVFCLLTLHLLQIGLHIAGDWKDTIAAVGFCTVRVHHFPLVHNGSVANVNRVRIKINGIPSKATDSRAAQSVSHGQLHGHFQRFPAKQPQ